MGASAGGLGALTDLLKALPAHSGLGFVLIQHLDPKHESALTQILSKATAMRVLEATDGIAVQPDHVYVIPPNKGLSIERRVLRVNPRERTSAPHHPIDEFYAALAEEQQGAAIGVILSGSGSDGTLGLKAIQGRGRYHLRPGPANGGMARHADERNLRGGRRLCPSSQTDRR